MKAAFVCLLLIASIACGGSHNSTHQTATIPTAPTNPTNPSQNQTVFSNINNNSRGWGSCTICAGGLSQATSYWMAQFQSNPSRDGSSSEFYISGSQPYSNVLFWNKLGAFNFATQFTWDFWVYLDQASLGAEALEYDLFQFVGGVEYMFGSQCVYSSGYWDVWNQNTGEWVQTPLTCEPFSPESWHHIVWQVHRTSDQKMHFDSLTLDGVKHALNLVEGSGPLPYGWTDDLGVQWQLDTSTAPLVFREWVDSVTVTAQ